MYPVIALILNFPETVFELEAQTRKFRERRQSERAYCGFAPSGRNLATPATWSRSAGSRPTPGRCTGTYLSVLVVPTRRARGTFQLLYCNSLGTTSRAQPCPL